MRRLAALPETAARICAALAGSVFALSGVVYLCLGRWTTTRFDFWRIYDFSLNHTWLESALLKHDAHSLFFPSFLWLADLRFFHGNQLPLFVAGLAFFFITVALLLILVWQDETVGLTAKIVATLAVIVGNFWTARGVITASGGFNAINSLAMVGALVAVLVLPNMHANSARTRFATVTVVCAGFVASFTFGAGLAIWPALFFLAWGLRLPWRSFVPLGIAAAAALVIYHGLPPRPWHSEVIQLTGSTGLTLVTLLCRLAGTPFLYATSGWHDKPLSADAVQSSLLPQWCGGTGLAIAAMAMVFTLVRRDLGKSSLKLIGMALVTFTVVVMALVIVGRASRLRAQPFEVSAARYLFYSTLFWTGLLLIAIQYAESKSWLRWPVYLVALALPILTFPGHYRYGLNLRRAAQLADYGAVSLVNGVRDEQQVRMPLGDPELVYQVAEQLRGRRLDMFSAGWQDWIGLAEADLFGRRYTREKLQGRCSVTALVQCDDGAPAARVTGEALKHGGRVPKLLIIVDPTGVVRGVARSSSTSPFINRVFYLGKANVKTFVGYIRDYNPRLRYVVRSADNRVLSEEEIPVQARTTEPTNP
jgi:hypothetical protein